MLILSLDTATEAAACAVLQENKFLGEITINYKKQHSVVLLPMIDNLLKSLHLSIQDIDGFVVSKGPGSFTGLRIGMAAIKGLSQGSGKPFISISTLDSLAYNLAFTDGIICPILDALRDNVYTALYTFKDSTLVKIEDYMAISVDELIEILNSKKTPVTFVGDAVPIHGSKLSSMIENIRFAPAHLNFANASSLGELGIKLLSEGHSDDLFTAAPIYLRKSQAEREYDKKMENKNNA